MKLASITAIWAALALANVAAADSKLIPFRPEEASITDVQAVYMAGATTATLVFDEFELTYRFTLR